MFKNSHIYVVAFDEGAEETALCTVSGGKFYSKETASRYKGPRVKHMLGVTETWQPEQNGSNRMRGGK